MLFRSNLNAAKTEFQETLRIRPDDVPARLALLQISSKNNAYADVLRYAGEILALDPHNRPARFWNAVGRMGQGNNDLARIELMRFLRDYPDSKDAQLQLGLLDLKEKKFKEAEVIFRKFYQPNSADARPLEGLIRMYAAQEDLDKAFQTAQAEVARSPNSKPAHSLLAAVASAAGKPASAIEQYQWLVSSDPKNLAYQIALAQVYQASGDTGHALETFHKAQEMAPRDGRVLAAIAFLLDAAGQRGEAKANYQRALQMDPTNPVILNNLAYLLADTHDNLDEALRLVKDAQRQLPNDPGLTDTLAWVYVQKNFNEGAIQILSRLVKEHPNDPGYHYHLAVACLQSGDKTRAKRELETALSNRPEKATADRIKALIAKIG